MHTVRVFHKVLKEIDEKSICIYNAIAMLLNIDL